MRTTLAASTICIVPHTSATPQSQPAHMLFDSSLPEKNKKINTGKLVHTFAPPPSPPVRVFAHSSHPFHILNSTLHSQSFVHRQQLLLLRSCQRLSHYKVKHFSWFAVLQLVSTLAAELYALTSHPSLAQLCRILLQRNPNVSSASAVLLQPA